MSLTRVAIPLSGKIGDKGAVALQTLARDLGAMGITVTLPDSLAGGELVFEYDRDAYKRGAGRKRKPAPADCVIARLNETETDDWLIRTAVETIAEDLGVSRSTAYRRKAEAKQRVEYAMVKVKERHSVFPMSSLAISPNQRNHEHNGTHGNTE